MKIYIGLDDSGRGPVIGPMILAAVAINEKQKDYLKSIGVRDSKKLTRSQRNVLEKEIKNNCIAYKLLKITPEEIDKRVGLYNLNKIEAIKFAKLINEIYEELEKRKLLKKVKGKIIVIVDCPSTNIKQWKLFLEQYIREDIKKELMIIAKHKAEMHIFVAAASILAKEKREREIEKIKQLLGYDFGSGYPSDERTIEFLKTRLAKFKEFNKEHYFIRESWQTTKDIKKEKEQKKLKEFFH